MRLHENPPWRKSDSDVDVGRVPALNGQACPFTLKVSRTPMSVECLFSMTLLRGAGVLRDAAADSVWVGPDVHCLPRHGSPFDSRNEGSMYLAMTWRATSARPSVWVDARAHGVGARHLHFQPQAEPSWSPKPLDALDVSLDKCAHQADKWTSVCP